MSFADLGYAVLALVLYRGVLSPYVTTAARRLGARRFPGPGINGPYAGGPVERGVVLPLAAVATLLTVAAATGTAALTAAGHEVLACAAVILLWRYGAADYDIVQDLGWQRRDRLVLLATGLATVAFPPVAAFFLPWLGGRVGGWTHHGMACARVLKMGLACLLAAPAAALLGVHPDASRLSFVLLGSAFLSHYFAALVAKLKLGPRPWSWALHNRTELLVASSWSWGWLRSVGPASMARVIAALSRTRLLLNTGTCLIEALGLVAWFDRGLLVAAFAGCVLFNLTVAAGSGLVFAENVLLALAFVGAAFLRHGGVALGLAPGLTGLAVLLLVATGLLWRPAELGWWDSALTTRVWWAVRTATAGPFTLATRLMSPYDREFGRMLGNYLTGEVFLTYSLGPVIDPGTRTALTRPEPDAAEIAALKLSHGQTFERPGYRAANAAYLRRFFTALNEGRRKSPVPRWLRPPASHSYGGGLPSYAPAEHGPVISVDLVVTEICFHSRCRRWDVVYERTLDRIDIPGR
ncbi:hypothetical protein [Actinoplanes sp. N902-109]|uniref:hypothetical protein n=1 Tax=Actinoplanes sp. (strain N902-109) TaxID=649831 RepID=UPI00032937CF|nr:hypothetical protein [Actinoplanes sp. N902-109]AGL18999.1 hypothetical protein L083_5489 [Actinoplanes sp. N902-109]